MPYGIKRILEIDAERKKRREEKARLKAERDRIKKEKERKERKRLGNNRRAARYYAKKVKEREKYHKSIGDKYGTYLIYLVKDRVRIKCYGTRRYRVAATQLYYKTLHDNNDKVMFHKTMYNNKHRIISHKYELILVERTENENASLLRNEEGKFIENVVEDNKNYRIIIKNEWYIEETFHVYGFDPYTDRKDFSFILNNIILKNTDVYTRVIAYKNKIIHHYDDDLDFVICNSKKQAFELYNKLEKMVDKKKYPNIFFMGSVEKQASSWLIDDLMEKTGWTRLKCRRED